MSELQTQQPPSVPVLSNIKNSMSFRNVPMVILVGFTFSCIISFFIPLIAYNYNNKTPNETGVLNTIFLVLSITAPFLYFILISALNTDINKKVGVLFLIIILSLVNLFSLTKLKVINEEKYAFEFIFNFFIGLVTFIGSFFYIISN